MTFGGIPLRTQGVADVSWWNSLRAAGIAIEAFLGSFIGATSFTIANNQGAAANVTGLAFDGTAVRGFEVDYTIYRNTTSTGATELAECGKLIGVYKTVAGSWEMAQGPVVGDAGVVLSITAAGQIQYTSSNITGTPATSKMTFTAKTIGV